MVLDKIKSGFTSAVSSIDNKLSDSLSFLGDLKEAGSEKVNSLVSNIQELAPSIDKTGFKMHEVEVSIGIPPDIRIAFTKEQEVDPATIDQLLQENEDRPLFKLIVQTLQKADTVVKDMKLSNFKLDELSMKIGLPPDVVLKLARLENAE
jgi:hypothetical protein